MNEVAAFDAATGGNLWRARHTPPGRGLLRTVTAIAARAASLYFRYGGAASTVFRGAQLLNTLSAYGSLRWSGLAAHTTLTDLTSLAANYGRDYAQDYAQGYARERLATFGVLARARQFNNARNSPRPLSIPRPSVDVEDRLLDRLDPSTQLERLSRFLLRTRRLAALRGQWMYFYTDLRSGHGLAGVNLNTGASDRAIRTGDPPQLDARTAVPTVRLIEECYQNRTGLLDEPWVNEGLLIDDKVTRQIDDKVTK